MAQTPRAFSDDRAGYGQEGAPRAHRDRDEPHLQPLVAERLEPVQDTQPDSVILRGAPLLKPLEPNAVLLFALAEVQCRLGH